MSASSRARSSDRRRLPVRFRRDRQRSTSTRSRTNSAEPGVSPFFSASLRRPQALCVSPFFSASLRRPQALCVSSLHESVLRPALPFSRCPSRADYIRRLAIHTVCLIHNQLPVDNLVHSRGTHVHVKLGNFGRDVRANYEMRWNRVARRIPRFEVRVELAESELSVGSERFFRRDVTLGFCVRV